MTARPLVKQVCDVVRLVDLFITLNPGYPLVGAVDVICDREGIADDRDRRAVRRGVEARQSLLESPERRAA